MTRAILLLALVTAGPALRLARSEETPATRWQFIVIHHSATAVGSAERFDEMHRARGMVNGLAYHFVIGNSSDGQPDGTVETGPRWTKQLAGGHCRQAHVNEHGIGICLVGDFTKVPPSEKQLAALVKLVQQLQQEFEIANDQIVGHGEIFGEHSQCPGQEFPWTEFRARLKK